MERSFDTYLFSYNHEGHSWCFEIQADSREDAQARVARLAFATYDGEIVTKVPASLGWPARLLVMLRNRARELFHTTK